jgi:hypothetical protein
MAVFSFTPMRPMTLPLIEPARAGEFLMPNIACLARVMLAHRRSAGGIQGSGVPMGMGGLSLMDD